MCHDIKHHIISSSDRIGTDALEVVDAQQEFDKTGKENADLKEWRELQARWNQFGCFVPLYRTHGDRKSTRLNSSHSV